MNEYLYKKALKVGGKPIDNFGVFNTKDLHNRIEIGKLYRPEYYSIMIIKAGHLSLIHNLSEYEVGKDTLLFLLPNGVYEFNQTSDDFEVEGIIYTKEFLNQSGIHLSSSNIMEVFASGFQPFYQVSKDEMDVLLQLVDLVRTSLNNTEETPYSFEIKKHGFLTFFYNAASIYRKHNAAYKIKLNRPEELSLNFLQSLALHFKEERSVQFYAEQLYVTPRHLSQTVKEVIGRSAGELIDRAVIMEAKILLRNPALNVGQVAEELHFSDQFFFAKFFKKHTGFTPTQYRTQQ